MNEKYLGIPMIVVAGVLLLNLPMLLFGLLGFALVARWFQPAPDKYATT